MMEHLGLARQREEDMVREAPKELPELALS